MLHATVQHALTAMQAGRLHEAAALLNQPGVRPHRRAQEALTTVVEQLIARAAAHQDAGDDRAAEADAQRVLDLAPDHPDALTLRHALRDRRQADRARNAQQLAHARRLAHLGDSSAARSALSSADGPERQRLEDDLDARRAERRVLLERGESALTTADWPAAARTLARLAALRPTAETRHLRRRVHAAAVDAVAEHLRDGNLEAAQRLAALGLSNDADHPVLAALADLGRAADALARHDAAAALVLTRRGATRLPEAQWLADAVDQLTALRDAQDALGAGPLSEAAGGSVPASATGRPAASHRLPLGCPNALTHTVEPHHPMPLPSPPPAPLILHRDGEPLAAVASAPAVALTSPGHAPAATDADADVLGLLTGPDTPAVTLTRDDEGHLLRGGAGVTVNDRSVERALLADGDRIALGPRLRLVYRRPNPASQTAVLEVSAGRLARPDLRRVVLLAGELLIGPHRGCHLRDAAQSTPLVVRPGGGTLLLDGTAIQPGASAHPHGGAGWSVALLPHVS